MKYSLVNYLPTASFAATTATGHQMERTLLPGTSSLAVCNNQLRIQYSGVHPTASSALSRARTALFVHRLDYLKKIIRIVLDKSRTIKKIKKQKTLVRILNL